MGYWAHTRERRESERHRLPRVRAAIRTFTIQGGTLKKSFLKNSIELKITSSVLRKRVVAGCCRGLLSRASPRYRNDIRFICVLNSAALLCSRCFSAAKQKHALTSCLCGARDPVRCVTVQFSEYLTCNRKLSIGVTYNVFPTYKLSYTYARLSKSSIYTFLQFAPMRHLHNAELITRRYAASLMNVNPIPLYFAYSSFSSVGLYSTCAFVTKFRATLKTGAPSFRNRIISFFTVSRKEFSAPRSIQRKHVRFRFFSRVHCSLRRCIGVRHVSSIKKIRTSGEPCVRVERERRVTFVSSEFVCVCVCARYVMATIMIDSRLLYTPLLQSYSRILHSLLLPLLITIAEIGHDFATGTRCISSSTLHAYNTRGTHHALLVRFLSYMNIMIGYYNTD